MKKEIIIISVGGSLVFPKEIDLNFLKNFRNLILKYLSKKKFFIYIGGGKIARIYQNALTKFNKKNKDLDQIGIFLTRINAFLVQKILGKHCYHKIITDPTKKIKTKKDIIICAGWKPGWSTDYDTVLLAKTYKIKTIINLTNIDYVYDKDPKKFPNAKPFKILNWQKYRELFCQRWLPGLSTPFDPLAAKLAQKLKIKVVIINGKKLKRLENFLNKKQFIGTVIF